MKPGSQDYKVLRHLENHDHITPLQALGLYGVFRLAARIHVIKDHLAETNDRRVVETEIVKDPNGKTYARYRLRFPAVAAERAPIPRNRSLVVMQKGAA